MDKLGMKDFFGMPWLPINGSAHGDALDSINIWVQWLMLILMVGWGIFFIYTLIRFRQSRNPKADYVGVTSHNSTYLEIAVALVEVVLLVGFSIPLWAAYTEEFPDEAESLVIRVVAEQFAWNFHYPGPDGVFGESDPELVDSEDNPLGLDRDEDEDAYDDIVTQVLHLPVNKPVITHVTSKDVIHNFGIPVMRVKLDAIPGSSIPVSFTPILEGKFLIACSQLCGLGHSAMQGFIEVHSQEGYDEWMAEEVAELELDEEEDE